MLISLVRLYIEQQQKHLALRNCVPWSLQRGHSYGLDMACGPKATDSTFRVVMGAVWEEGNFGKPQAVAG